jgi:hypothetical protein
MIRLRTAAPARPLLILACLTAVFALALGSTGHAAGRTCGLTARIHGVRYDVREVRGALPCVTIKRVVTRFIGQGTVARPWTCARGHGASPFAVSCARGEQVLVRVYAPS